MKRKKAVLFCHFACRHFQIDSRLPSFFTRELIEPPPNDPQTWERNVAKEGELSGMCGFSGHTTASTNPAKKAGRGFSAGNTTLPAFGTLECIMAGCGMTLGEGKGVQKVRLRSFEDYNGCSLSGPGISNTRWSGTHRVVTSKQVHNGRRTESHYYAPPLLPLITIILLYVHPFIAPHYLLLPTSNLKAQFWTKSQTPIFSPFVGRYAGRSETGCHTNT